MNHELQLAIFKHLEEYITGTLNSSALLSPIMISFKVSH